MNQEEKKIIAEEEKLVAEVKKERKAVGRLLRDVRVLIGLVVLIALGSLIGFAVWSNLSSRVYVDKAQVSADKIDLASPVSGKLDEVDVKVGDMVDADAVVARVGDSLVKSKTAGLVIMARTDLGKIVAPGEPVVSVIDPAALRVVGQVEEDKGLASISVGNRAVFTVDTFGGRKFVGIVDEVSPTSRSGDVVFNISDKRQKNEFDVKVRYDAAAYPELKNGMSAKLWIYHD